MTPPTTTGNSMMLDEAVISDYENNRHLEVRAAAGTVTLYAEDGGDAGVEVAMSQAEFHTLLAHLEEARRVAFG